MTRKIKPNRILESFKNNIKCLNTLFDQWFFVQVGQVDLNTIDQDSRDWESLIWSMASLVEDFFYLEDVVEHSKLNLQEIIPTRVVVDSNYKLCYWGVCDSQFPFYAEFLKKDEKLTIDVVLFQCYNNVDLSVESWVDQQVDWVWEHLN